MTRLISIDQAAEMLSLSRDFVERRKREFGAVKAGRVYRVPLSSVEEWVKRNTLAPHPPARIRLVDDGLIARARREVR